MATEAPQERPNEAIVNSDEPTITIDSVPQNVDSDQPQLNGDTASTADEIENKQISDIVDDLVNSAEVSISGGSDTEASRSKLSDDKGHGRTSSSVKKPTSFKAVSVNKTFLAAKGASTTAPLKSADKSAVTSGTSTPGTGSLGAARPRLIAKSGSGLVTRSSSTLNGGKGTAPDPNAVWNKNRPVPPPEPKKLTDEELKKYGIHMATRLHTDDSKGQANWADIDDDDDDWAPESITWADGTKVTIPHVEEHAQAPAPATPSPIAAPATVQQAAQVEKPRSPAPTILTSKPSLPSGKGIVFTKGAPEKPTLVAKPPAPPTPAKSPWAQIPKVDKASPIVVEHPAAQQGPARYGMGAPGPRSITPPPPKEIAADDFSRSHWRDGPGAPNRELFNSQSGRYEPAPDRRGSARTDQHGRPATLLQRTTHETQGPAEPSTAFQTSRVSDQHHGYGRRRGSSIISGGSGQYMQAKAHEQPLAPPEVLGARRESFTTVTDGPRSPIRNYSPTVPHPGQRPMANQPWQPHVSPASAQSVPHAQPTEAQVTGGPPNAAVAAPIEDALALQKRLMHEKRELAMKRRQEEEAREEAARKERIRLKLEALGPAPESRSAKKAATKDESPAEPPTQPQEPPVQIQKPIATDTKPAATVAPLPPKVSPKTETPISGISDQPQVPKLQPTESVEVRQQQQGPPNVAAGWPTGPAHGPARPQPFSQSNVWASSYNDNRSLGNGTFDTELASKPVPGPIAPPSTSRIPSGPAARPAPIGTPVRRAPGAQPRMMNAWAAQVQADDVAMTKELRARRDAQDQALQSAGLDVAAVQAPIQDTWRPTKVTDDGRRITTKAQQAYHASKAPGWGQSTESGTVPHVQAPMSSQASSGSDQVQQRPAAISQGDVSSSILGSTTPQTKGSRFFPSRDVRHEPAAGPDNQHRSSSPSPPPPDMAGHPAFDGDVSHPHVSLPRPQPRVRLPPSQVLPAPIAPPQHGSGPNFGWAAPAPYKEPEAPAPASTAPLTWQARFDHLLGVKNPSHAKSVQVDSASRRSLEHPQYAQNATVSLPRGLFNNLPTDDSGSPTSKAPSESCFEEQVMGSLPQITIPKDVPEAAWHPSPAPKLLPKKLWPSVSSAEQLWFNNETSGNGVIVHIFAPGMNDRKSVTMPFTRNRSNPRPRGRGGRHPSHQQRGGKGRDASASYAADQPSSAGPSSVGNRGGRGGYPRDPRRDNWSRHNGPAAIPT